MNTAENKVMLKRIHFEKSLTIDLLKYQSISKNKNANVNNLRQNIHSYIKMLLTTIHNRNWLGIVKSIFNTYRNIYHLISEGWDQHSRLSPSRFINTN